MEILEGIKTRRSVRSFLPKRIPKAVIRKILRAAGASPSYTNTQPWEAVVVSGKKRAQLAAELVKLATANAPIASDIAGTKNWPPALEERFREHGARRLNALKVARDDQAAREKLRLANFQFYGAPCAVFLFMDASLGEWSVFDMGLFAENLTLAAHALGVESCLQASVTSYAREIKRFVGVSESKKLVICIALGYPDDRSPINAYRSTRQKPDEFTMWLE